MTSIEFPDSGFTRPTAINNLGRIVGTYQPIETEGETSSFVFWKGRFTRIHLPGTRDTEICGINDRGQIVGWYTDASGQHGFETNLYQFLRKGAAVSGGE